MAPVQAAQLEGRKPDLDTARRTLSALCARHAVIVVEGIGGLLVPLDSKTLCVDFIRETGFPVILVARAALGTINHTLLSLHELDRAGISNVALVMNVTRQEDDKNLVSSIEEIERHAGRKVTAIMPHNSSQTTCDAQRAALCVLEHVKIQPSLKRPRQ